jgi:predicted histidine transporter YuiF (NhaC family)
MAGVLTLVWIALAFAAIAVVAGLVTAVSRGFRAWRTLRSLLRATSRRLGELERKAAATEEHAVAVTAKSAKVVEAAERVQDSLATLGVLREAFGEATAPIARARNLAPKK